MHIASLSFSGIEEFKLVRKDIKDFLDAHLDSNNAFYMNVAINEAINNSLIHGRSTFINLDLLSSNRKLFIKIEDNGSFFDGTEHVKKIRESNEDLFNLNLHKEGNRGLLILEKVCDEVVYNGKNQLLLIKSIV